MVPASQIKCACVQPALPRLHARRAAEAPRLCEPQARLRLAGEETMQRRLNASAGLLENQLSSQLALVCGQRTGAGTGAQEVLGDKR